MSEYVNNSCGNSCPSIKYMFNIFIYYYNIYNFYLI